MLELNHITKTFGSNTANDDVSLHVERGALHGLLGENGAGKSTLVKIVAGYQQPDSGTIVVNGRPTAFRSSRDAIEAGIGLLHQDPAVFLPLTVIENFVLGDRTSFRMDRRGARTRLARSASEFGFSFDPDALVRDLSVGERQQLEITRLLDRGAQVLILDEPTTAISVDQRAELFATLEALSERGMAVIFVSHKLEEVEQLCTAASVLRLGRTVADFKAPFDTDQVLQAMFGAPPPPPTRQATDLGSPAISLENVKVLDGRSCLQAFSFSARRAEVVGLAGLEGSGQRTALRACAGYLKPQHGNITVGTADLARSPYREYDRAGVHYVPADRLEEGLVAGLSIAEHAALVSDQGRRWIDWSRARADAETMIGRFNIKGTVDSAPETLSGGNQQRLLLSLAPTKLAVLLMEHPTRGLDIESAAWVWTQLLERRNTGTSILFVSADLEELVTYSDRVVVFFEERVVGEFDPRTEPQDRLGRLIAGKLS